MMPMTDKGKKTMADMVKKFGERKGKKVFYATSNKKPGFKHAMEGK